MTDMTNAKPITGRCQCGAVRFKVRGPIQDLYHCPCSMCRRVHGTVFATYATVARNYLVIEQGEANLATYDTSKSVHRHFCKTCGCQMFIDVDDTPEKRWFMPGICDWPEDMREPPKPLEHVYVGSKVPWLPLDDGLPRRDVV
jgi:hypothetical protein